jgi:hypothetical protein
MKKLLKLISFFSILVLTLSHCASRTYEDDQSDPSYQSGKNFPVGQNVGTPPDSPLAKDPLLPNQDANNAAIGLVASAISLAANRDYYKSVAITGKVICRSSAQNQIQFPCNNVEVALLDTEGKTLTQVEPSGGEFAFRVPENKLFRLKIASTYYKMSPVVTKSLVRGDDVILNLYPTNK